MNRQPTPKQLSAARAVFMAMAVEQTVRPVVEAYEAEILASREWRASPEWVEQGIDVPGIIIKRRDIFLMTKDDINAFAALCHERRDAAGLRVSHPDNCPLLEAKSTLLDAETALLIAFDETVPGLLEVARAPLAERAKAVDLCLKLCAPLVGDAAKVLEEATA